MASMTFDDTRLIPNSAAYQRLHRWVKKELGKADHCSINPSHKSKYYDWSNVSKQYLADTSDWQMLCRACHRAYDPITADGRKRLSEIKKIQSKGNTSHNTAIIGIDNRNRISYLYSSVKEASVAIGRTYTAISNCLGGNSKTSGGLEWRYKEAK